MKQQLDKKEDIVDMGVTEISFNPQTMTDNNNNNNN